MTDGEWDHRHPVFNKEVWDKMQAAEEEYLLANGWDRLDADDWDEPWGRSERTLSKGHAVNAGAVMITLELLQKTVRDALCRASWLNCPVGSHPADTSINEADLADVTRLETKLLCGKTEDGWHFVLASFLRDEKPWVRGYSGMATHHSLRGGLIVHLTRAEAEAGFQMAVRGMN